LRRFKALFLVSLLACLMAVQPAFAQSWQCRAPEKLSRPSPIIPKQSQIRRTSVDGYVLALSWSREYCKSRGNRARNLLQCNGKIGEFGFILHGLWPEARGPNYPQYCRKVGALSRKIVARNICMTPSVSLLQREWAKHGSCMARRPETYFGAARLMFKAIEFPDMDFLSRQYKRGKPLTAGGLAEAFETNNADLPASSVRVITNRKGWLKEVRICLGKDFMPRRCPAWMRGAKSKSIVKIWRGD